jgi:hypothetical protein
MHIKFNERHSPDMLVYIYSKEKYSRTFTSLFKTLLSHRQAPNKDADCIWLRICKKALTRESGAQVVYFNEKTGRKSRDTVPLRLCRGHNLKISGRCTWICFRNLSVFNKTNTVHSILAVKYVLSKIVILQLLFRLKIPTFML